MTKPLEVWVVDDDASIRWVLERALRQAGLAPTTFDRADAVLAALATRCPDVLLTDLRMPGTEGLRLLEIARREHPGLPVIVMTAHADLDHAVAAYRGGAFEYLPKPFDIDEAVALVRRASAPGSGLPAGDAGTAIPGILGHAPAMQEVFRARTGRSSRSTPRRSPRSCSSRSSSATRRAPSPARTPCAAGASSRRTGARSSSTRSAT